MSVGGRILSWHDSCFMTPPKKKNFVYQGILAMPSAYIHLQGIQKENSIHLKINWA